MQKFIFRNFQAPGDIVMLTAAVRDLHSACPTQYQTDVRTSAGELWQNNPLLTSLNEMDPDVRVIDCEYPLINQSNERPIHFLQGFSGFIADRLQVPIPVSKFKGDIYLSESESAAPPFSPDLHPKLPMWVISGGGKSDFTVKWWDHGRYQEVIDHFQGQIQFVQVGAAGHHHPRLLGAVDLRGRTSIRELVSLVYHSDGVLTPVSFLMHLAAAVGRKPREGETLPRQLPCVVIAGGREPSHWEAYPGHQFMHTVGMLACCEKGGCWRSRTTPLGDGSDHDEPRRLCVDVVGNLPRCMDLITAQDVIRRIEMFMDGEKPAPVAPIYVTPRSTTSSDRITDESSPSQIELALSRIPVYPEGKYEGRGIVICGGGERYTPPLWVCVQMLRKEGCKLPIQIWHLGDQEMPAETRAVFEGLEVEFVDALRMNRMNRARRLGGWEMKSFAIMRSPFAEVLLLDADNMPLVDPEFLFETPQFKEHGAIFWPDIGRISKEDPIWKICGVEYRDEPEFESGQIVVDKARCWKALSLAQWLNERSDFYYKKFHGDKETFHFGFRKAGKEYAMPPFRVRLLKATMCQHDFEGRRIFQHRNLDKWRLDGSNFSVPKFERDPECREFLAILRERLREESAINGKLEVSESGASEERLGAILLRAPINRYTGYGMHAHQIFRDLKDRGCRLNILPTEVREFFAPVGDDVRRAFVSKPGSEEWELLLHPPQLDPLKNKKTLYFTMWESSALPPSSVGRLNQADCIVVPSQWNKRVFEESGVTVPIEVIPLGIDNDVFRFSRMSLGGPCVFGAAGRFESDPKRKRIEDVIDVFLEAFPTESDVQLWVKVFPDCAIPKIADPRIKVTRRFLSESQLAKWFRGLTCFVSLARAEGWGLMQHQALRTGRPVISCAWGGITEFFDSDSGYAIPFELGPAEGQFSGHGSWAHPDESAVVAAMRRVYDSRTEACEIGQQASKKMEHFSWQNSNAKLYEILTKLGAVKNASHS